MLLRKCGLIGQDNCVGPGALNANLNEIHAAMALASLDEINQQIANNCLRYRQYQTGLARLSSIRLIEFDESFPTSYKNILVELLDDWPLQRDETVAILNAENILARAYYSPSLHQKNMSYPHISSSLEITDFLSKRYMLLPCGDFVSCADIDEIIQLLEFVCFHGSEISSKIVGR